MLNFHKQNIYCVSHHSCLVIHDYKKSEISHFTLFFQTSLNLFLLKFCLSHIFRFDRNVFNNKIPNAKHSHLWNGLGLTLKTVHQSIFYHFLLLVTSFLFDVNENFTKKNYFKFQIQEKSYFWSLSSLMLKNKNSPYFSHQVIQG